MNQCTETRDSKCSFLKSAKALFSLLFTVVFILLGCGTEQKIKRLQVKLRNENANVRREAVLSLADMGRSASSATPALIGILSDEEDIVRGSAAFALSRIENPGEAAAIPKLIQISMEEGSDFTQRSSLDALVSFRELAVPKLIPLLASNNNIQTRIMASEALSRIGLEASEAADALIDALYDSNENVRENVMRSLGRINTSKTSKALDEYKSGGISSLLTRVKNIRKKIETVDSEVNTDIEEQIASLPKPALTKITPKDEFENQIMYEKRVDTARQKDREQKQKYETEKKAIRDSTATRIEAQSKKYQKQLASLRKEIILDDTQFQLELGKYDADKEIFPNAVIEANESGVIPLYQWRYEVPLQQAKTFKKSVIEGKISIQVHVKIDHSNATAQIFKVVPVDLTYQ